MQIEQKESQNYLDSELQLVLFDINNIEYALNIHSISEIIKLMSINPLPGAPEFIRGVINLRGKIIPIVDLQKDLL